MHKSRVLKCLLKGEVGVLRREAVRYNLLAVACCIAVSMRSSGFCGSRIHSRTTVTASAHRLTFDTEHTALTDGAGKKSVTNS